MTIKVEGVAPLLQVFDMPTSVAFYRDVLGFTVVDQSATGDDFDDRPSVPDPTRSNPHEDTGLFFGCPDVDGAFEHLRSKGVTVDPPKVAPYGMKQLYLKDPDGYVFCFQWSEP